MSKKNIADMKMQKYIMQERKILTLANEDGAARIGSDRSLVKTRMSPAIVDMLH